MKSILISIKPQWCEKITAGIKKVEVRKNRPMLAPPFKCYIYETRTRDHYAVFHKATMGKVVGEFTCDFIEEFTPTEKGVSFKRFWALYESCLSVAEIRSYLGEKVGYGWHISDLVIYDEPKSLHDFTHCGANYHINPQVKKPPQSWCYVEVKK